MRVLEGILQANGRYQRLNPSVALVRVFEVVDDLAIFGQEWRWKARYGLRYDSITLQPKLSVPVQWFKFVDRKTHNWVILNGANADILQYKQYRRNSRTRKASRRTHVGHFQSKRFSKHCLLDHSSVHVWVHSSTPPRARWFVWIATTVVYASEWSNFYTVDG